jgi:YVTN family beta-propeller protein
LAGAYLDAAQFEHGFVSATGPFAYAANINSNTVSVIDIPTSLPVTAIPVGSGPWGVAVSPDETQVYVTNNHGNNVSVVNTASSTVVATIPVQTSPFAVAFTPDGTAAYVVNGSSNSVSVIDTASQTVAATVPVQSSPVGVAMALTSDGAFAYVTNSASNTVSVIAVGSTPTVLHTITVGSGPRWVAVSPNSSLAYVENAGSNNVSVISVASNTVTATISVGTSPFGAAFTPDNSIAYVVNSASNTVSVIDTASSSVVATVTGFDDPAHVALTADGASAYVTNLRANNVSVIATASNTITSTAAVGSAPIGVAIAGVAPTSKSITQPLSPTLPNVFNFGTNNFSVQYPVGTSFSNVKMTVKEVEITQSEFQKRVAGTEFAKATCIVYAGAGGNCVDDQVTCSENGSPISCPSEAEPTIAVQTNFSTSQAITNPGYLTTPIGENEWQNIFTGFTDPAVRGKTAGFSEFVAVDLGATNSQGLAKLTILYPKFPKTFCDPQNIPIAIHLASVAKGTPITDAQASISVVMIADAQGNPTNRLVFSGTNVFKQTTPGVYEYDLNAAKYQTGTYTVTIYGNAFPAYQGQFKIMH